MKVSTCCWLIFIPWFPTVHSLGTLRTVVVVSIVNVAWQWVLSIAGCRLSHGVWFRRTSEQIARSHLNDFNTRLIIYLFHLFYFLKSLFSFSLSFIWQWISCHSWCRCLCSVRRAMWRSPSRVDRWGCRCCHWQPGQEWRFPHSPQG